MRYRKAVLPFITLLALVAVRVTAAQGQQPQAPPAQAANGPPAAAP